MEERMSASVMGLPRLALLALSGMLFLLLSSDPSSAQSPGLHALKPGQVREVVRPAATVIATEHYQAEIGLICGGFSCSGHFPKPGNKRQLNITRMSCYIINGSGSTYYNGSAELQSAAGSHVLYQWLPADYSISVGYHLLNRAVDFLVGSQQHLFVNFGFSNAPIVGFCTATGTRDTLQ
jgi:hypothetical protein